MESWSILRLITDMKYENGTNQSQPTCLPPEAYIQLLRNVKNEGQPKFKSTYIPNKNQPKK